MMESWGRVMEWTGRGEGLGGAEVDGKGWGSRKMRDRGWEGKVVGTGSKRERGGRG